MTTADLRGSEGGMGGRDHVPLECGYLLYITAVFCTARAASQPLSVTHLLRQAAVQSGQQGVV